MPLNTMCTPLRIRFRASVSMGRTSGRSLLLWWLGACGGLVRVRKDWATPGMFRRPFHILYHMLQKSGHAPSAASPNTPAARHSHGIRPPCAPSNFFPQSLNTVPHRGESTSTFFLMVRGQGVVRGLVGVRLHRRMTHPKLPCNLHEVALVVGPHGVGVVNDQHHVVHTKHHIKLLGV